MSTVLKCKACGKTYIEDRKTKSITEMDKKKRPCTGGCQRLVSQMWVEKSIDGEAPKA